MWPTFEQALARYRELETLLGDPALIADRARYTQAAKEHGSLAKTVKPYLEYLKVADDVKQAEGLVAAETDAEMRRYAEEELASLKAEQHTLQGRLEELFLVDPGE